MKICIILFSMVFVGLSVAIADPMQSFEIKQQAVHLKNSSYVAAPRHFNIDDNSIEHKHKHKHTKDGKEHGHEHQHSKIVDGESLRVSPEYVFNLVLKSSNESAQYLFKNSLFSDQFLRDIFRPPIS